MKLNENLVIKFEKFKSIKQKTMKMPPYKKQNFDADWY